MSAEKRSYLEAVEKGTLLLESLDRKSTDGKTVLRLATCESLTGGLMMSLLVDIPKLGYVKYGGFTVYHTNAKRVFAGVCTKNLYTRRCAAEMALGTLRNSNASICVSVSGNSMPSPRDKHMVGEVFVGVAGYIQSEGGYKCICDTFVINECNTTGYVHSLCQTWHGNTQYQPTVQYATRDLTAIVSRSIRLSTCARAYDIVMDMLDKYNFVTPPSIEQNILGMEPLDDTPCLCANIPDDKFQRTNIEQPEIEHACEREESNTDTQLFRSAPPFSRTRHHNRAE